MNFQLGMALRISRCSMLTVNNLYFMIMRIRRHLNEEKVDRRRGRKPILNSGLGWTLPAQLHGQLRQDNMERVISKSSVVPKRPCKVVE